VAGKILVIDTSGETGSIALLDGPVTIAEMTLHAVQGVGEMLFGLIGELLASSGVSIKEIGCFGVAAGPGSFTGVRVALAAAKGLAETLERPIVAVSNLEAVASLGTKPWRAAILDARRGDVYAALYDEELHAVLPERVVKLADWVKELPEGAELLATSAELAGLTITSVNPALAGAIGRIAWDRWQRGLGQDAAEIDANYVRRSDAELFWKDK
jgi:tRNA threonylcarbamoyladenosine biosynthesis protein TsaB